jgi:hypothetical protein
MLDAPILPIVFMLLLLGALVFQLYSGPAAPRSGRQKSTLAKDGGLGGVGFLIPTTQWAAVAAMRAEKRKV